MADGATVTVRGVAITNSDFGDGGGYIADDTGGVAVLVSSGAFARGTELLVTGTIADRYAQRTIRTDAGSIVAIGSASEPSARGVATADVTESVEGWLVDIAGTVVGSHTALSGGIAVQVDDGSGDVRVFVADITGIDTGQWLSGSTLRVRGVVGQRDSSGSGTAGYRVQPRDPDDVVMLAGPPTPTPSPTPTATPSPSATPSATLAGSPSPTAIPSDQALVTIGEARAAASGTRLRIRGVVTLPAGLVEPGSAVVQDASAAILIRLGDDAGTLRRGELVELSGTRSTKAGMLSLRVTLPPVRLGFRAEPAGTRLSSGRADEAHEAQLILVRGAIVGRITRSTSGAVSFDVDDGSGPLHVVVGSRTGIPTAGLASGTWLELRGALGQQTTGSQPLRGYRLWPRDRGDVAIVASAATGGTAVAGSGATSPAADDGSGTLSDSASTTAGGPRAAASHGTRPGLAPPSGAGGAPPSLDPPPGEPPATGHSAPPSPAEAGSPTGPGRAPAPVGLLLIGLGGIAAAGATGWRTGLLGRLTGPRPDGPSAAGGHDAADPADLAETGDPDEIPLTRLSVVGGPELRRP
jgi:hypothetical protein